MKRVHKKLETPVQHSCLAGSEIPRSSATRAQCTVHLGIPLNVISNVFLNFKKMMRILDWEHYSKKPSQLQIGHHPRLLKVS
jgi:hypothetical protein